MKQLLIEVDEALLAALERVAPARSRQRSEFIRAAVRRALFEHQDRAMAEAYARRPDSDEPVALDPALWEGAAAAGNGNRKKAAAKPRASKAPPRGEPPARKRSAR